MRLLKNKLTAIVLLSILSSCLSASAVEIMRFDHKVAGFQDFANTGRHLVINENGDGYWMTGTRLQYEVKYKVTDDSCVPRTQSTMVMGDDVSGQGLTLAYPFLFGAERVCYINDKTRSIDLLKNFRPQLPRDYFSAVYAGETSDNSYFLINGRPYPDGEAGYLLLVIIDKQTLEVTLKELVNDVPGLSGAMLYTGDYVWITSWMNTNDIYRIPTDSLHRLISTGQTGSFLELATKVHSGIDGMSFFMLGNDSEFIYYNEGYDSYTVDKRTGVVGPAPSCSPVIGHDKGWLVLCDGVSLHAVESRN